MDTRVAFLVLLAVTASIGTVAAQTWEQKFLDPHNAARMAVNVPRLSWDWNLAKYAQTWANRQANLYNCQLRHSNGPYGENIYWSSWRSTPIDAVKSWVSEKPYYVYATNSCASGEMCGHYTQIVWKTTTKVGCASAKCPQGGTFTICNYNPPGNYIGLKPY